MAGRVSVMVAVTGGFVSVDVNLFVVVAVVVSVVVTVVVSVVVAVVVSVILSVVVIVTVTSRRATAAEEKVPVKYAVSVMGGNEILSQ